VTGESEKVWAQPAFWMIMLSVVLGGVTVWVGTQKNPSGLAVALLQGITLVFGTVGAFVLGKDASSAAARELVRPHARSAFRRVQNLYRGLSRQQEVIALEQMRLREVSELNDDGMIPFEQARASLFALGYMVIEQISTADDALEDWRDLVPDEVEAIEAAGRRREEIDG
jgi:hypothetical protein